jgi:hypothetical protein
MQLYMTINTGDLVPMFTATNLTGTRVDYHDLWQRKNLVLATLPPDDAPATAYAAALSRLTASMASHEAVLIVTTTPIAGIPSPGVVVADRWGEVYYVTHASRASELPEPDALMAWLQYIQNECPECQGEAR